MDIADRIVYLDRGAIKGIFTPAEFRRLSQDQRERMGLRATDLMDVFRHQSCSSRGNGVVAEKCLPAL